MVEELPEYGAIVDPHCDQETEGIPPGMPAWVQSVARDELTTPDHCCACPFVKKVRQSNVKMIGS
jgi:hypothetical protein